MRSSSTKRFNSRTEVHRKFGFGEHVIFSGIYKCRCNFEIERSKFNVQMVKLKLHLFRFLVDCCGFVVQQIHNKSNKWSFSLSAIVYSGSCSQPDSVNVLDVSMVLFTDFIHVPLNIVYETLTKQWSSLLQTVRRVPHWSQKYFA